MKRLNKMLILIAALMFLSSPVFAFRCFSGDLVEIGDLKVEVHKACGKPLFQDVVKNYRTKLEMWTYSADLIPGTFDRVVIFEDNRVVEIKIIE